MVWEKKSRTNFSIKKHIPPPVSKLIRPEPCQLWSLLISQIPSFFCTSTPTTALLQPRISINPSRSLLIHSSLLSFILQVAPSPGSSLQNANLIMSPPTSNSWLHMALGIGFKALCGCPQLTPQTPLGTVSSATQTSQPLRFSIFPPCTGPFRTCFFLCLEHSSLPSHLANTNSCFWSELNQVS